MILGCNISSGIVSYSLGAEKLVFQFICKLCIPYVIRSDLILEGRRLSDSFEHTSRICFVVSKSFWYIHTIDTVTIVLFFF